jgi:hypothetical protein
MAEAAAPAAAEDGSDKKKKKKRPRPKPSTKTTRQKQGLQHLVVSRGYNRGELGYTTHVAREARWLEMIGEKDSFAVNDPILKSFFDTVDVDVADGIWPTPLCVTTYGWKSGDGDEDVEFGVVAWTRFIQGAEGVQVEAVWIQPIQIKEGYMGTFINSSAPTLCDLTDMEEEVVIQHQCDNGLFIFPEHEHDMNPLWMCNDEGVAVVAPKVVELRGT